MPSIQSDPVRTVLMNPPQRMTGSPEDWRDVWIYFLMVDRFNNPAAPPRNLPFDAEFGGFQGGTIAGMQAKLSYLKELGVGAIWFTPVLFNSQMLDGVANDGTYHGYGIEDMLRVDPRFAANRSTPDAELIDFVNAAHALGLYVIFDIVLNHTGDVFEYVGFGSEAPFSATRRDVRWRDRSGNATAYADGAQLPSAAATLSPDELRSNAFFRQQGVAGPVETIGDFASLKQMLTADPAVGQVLIACYQYLMAKFDVDGYRIDTLKYLDPTFARIFGNAMREFALTIGKKNFFTFGEVYDDEHRIAEFIGRHTAAPDGDVVGVDAALDFPLFFVLPKVVKQQLPPRALVQMYQTRKQVEQGIVSSHGEASRYFVTFLDNHDQHSRFRWGDSRYDAQTQLGLACLFALPGIPCLYYGTEQGLSGSGGADLAVREALWGAPAPFHQGHPLYVTIQRLGALRAREPALRYGRFYFRPLSGDGVHFDISDFTGGVLAFSRILNKREVIVVANTDSRQSFVGQVIIDASLHTSPSTLTVLFSNLRTTATCPVGTTGVAEIHEADGSISPGPACVASVTLAPMQVLILA
jgi:glycosidase